MIDTKRLATDAAYWRECGAPEDAQEFGFSNGYFYKQENGTWFYFSRRNTNTWQECSMGQPLDDNLVPRPQAPEAEWVDGLPPAGCECEYRPDPSTRPDWWDPCTYLAHHKGEFFVIMHDNNGIDRMSDSQPADVRFRPTPSKEQRQREELAGLVYGALDKNIYMEDCEAVIDAILSRYNLEPKK